MEDKFDGQEEEVFDYLSDSCHPAYTALVRFALECKVEDVEAMMARRHYVQCPHCAWWVESFELIPEDEDEPDGHCENCRVEINE
jgi:hypothetical protein